MECKICRKTYKTRNSLIQHIIKCHKILFYDYCLNYDIDNIKCQYCGDIIPRNKFNHKLMICQSKICRSYVMMLARYDSNSDIFNICNPEYWLNYYNNDIQKTVDKLKYLKYFRRYLYDDKLFKIFQIEDLEIEYYKFINRIKNDSIKINDVKKHTNLNSIERYLSLGFSKNIYEKIHLHFCTDKNHFIDRHGIDKWNDYTKKISNKNIVSIWQTQYWINKGYSLLESQKIISDNARRDLNYFIKKYGESLGKEKYENMLLTRSYSSSLSGYQDKYGAELGFKKYHDIINKRISWCPNIQSKVSLKFLEDFKKYSSISKILDEEPISCYICDFYIPETKCIIEFYGDWWHRNYNCRCHPEEECEKCKLESDTRCNILLKNDKVDKIIIIWELAYSRDPNRCLLETIKSYHSKNRYHEINYDIDKRQIINKGKNQ